MTSSLLSLIGLSSLSCGDPLIGNQESLSSLMTLKVELLPPFENARPSGPVRVGVLWLDTGAPDAWCSIHAGITLGLPPSAGFGAEAGSAPLSPELASITAERCRDPLGVTPALAGESAPVPAELLGSGGVIELPLTRLPSAEVLYGAPNARLGYATVVLFEDLDGDATLTISEPKGWRRGGRRGGRDEELPEPDRVWGASFQSVTTPHQRLVYHEGKQVESLLFYPTAGCPPLPKGFAILESSLELLDLLAVLAPFFMEEGETPEPPTLRAGLCAIHELDRPIQVQVSPPSSRLQELVCEPLEDAGEEPPERAPEELEMTCVSRDELIAIDPSSPCKSILYWRLVGCPLGQERCEEPKWDMRTNIPQWWPCDVGGQ